MIDDCSCKTCIGRQFLCLIERGLEWIEVCKPMVALVGLILIVLVALFV